MYKLIFTINFAAFAITTQCVGAKARCVTSADGRLVTCDNNGGSCESPAEHLKRNTFTLIVKNSERLHLTPETHQDDEYGRLVNYQITEVADLEIEPKSFANLQHVRYMHIINSEWRVVKNHTFHNMSKLEMLIVANDSVQEVQPDAFKSLSGLDTLEITNNQITKLPPGVFQDLNSVTSLLLNHNNLESLDDGVFDGLTQLHTLDLSYNKLTVLRTSAINDLPSLTHLYLSHNEISEVDGGFSAPSLGVIHFKDNKLRRIRNDLFRNAATLRGIDLSGNEILELSDVPFKNLKWLAYLNVARNNLSDLTKIKQLKALVTY